MSRKVKLDPDALALKYITQLEADLKLERERIKVYRADVEFYRGKCEKLELALLEASPMAGAAAFVRRSDPGRRPSMGQVKLETAMKPKFSELKQKWEKLTAEQQEKIQETGEWIDEPEAASKG